MLKKYVFVTAAIMVCFSANAKTGKEVYEQTCFACHASGVLGAPKFGDKAAWAEEIAEGVEHLYEEAIKGDGNMPAKGGNPTLSDDEVKAAVDYMIDAAQ